MRTIALMNHARIVAAVDRQLTAKGLTQTRSLVWRASASGDLNLNDSPEKWEKKINKAAEKTFKHYPR